MNHPYAIYIETVRRILIEFFGKTHAEATALTSSLEPMSDIALNEEPYLAAHELANGLTPLSAEQYRAHRQRALEIWEEAKSL